MQGQNAYSPIFFDIELGVLTLISIIVSQALFPAENA